jgi:hypothetical protein
VRVSPLDGVALRGVDSELLRLFLVQESDVWLTGTFRVSSTSSMSMERVTCDIFVHKI